MEIWKRGWKYNERPKLLEMLNSIGKEEFPQIGHTITPVHNSLTHGDPDSAIWNIIQTTDGSPGYSGSQIVDNPTLCDKVCLEASTWLLVLTSMTMAITLFPKDPGD